ncbi:MAG: general secretion pathway protein G [Granulosicoccus sp.]|jgi:general secretion pathway protein G
MGKQIRNVEALASCGVRKRLEKVGTAQKGFTLIEIMVVVAIIAILGATVVPLIMDRPNEARVVRAKNDIASFSSALELYKLDNFNYPSTDQGLEALVAKPSGDPEPVNWNRSGYVKRLAKDPWGRDYLYAFEDGDFEIVSLGNDGSEGGEDFDADISNQD